jgi:hypothetical protein
MSKVRGYLARATQCEARANKTRDPESREWNITLARAYRMLAEAESEATALRRIRKTAAQLGKCQAKAMHWPGTLCLHCK